MLFRKKSVSNIFQINAFSGCWASELSIFAHPAIDSVDWEWVRPEERTSCQWASLSKFWPGRAYLPLRQGVPSSRHSSPGSPFAPRGSTAPFHCQQRQLCSIWSCRLLKLSDLTLQLVDFVVICGNEQTSACSLFLLSIEDVLGSHLQAFLRKQEGQESAL